MIFIKGNNHIYGDYVPVCASTAINEPYGIKMVDIPHLVIGVLTAVQRWMGDGVVMAEMLLPTYLRGDS